MNWPPSTMIGLSTSAGKRNLRDFIFRYNCFLASSKRFDYMCDHFVASHRQRVKKYAAAVDRDMLDDVFDRLTTVITEDRQRKRCKVNDRPDISPLGPTPPYTAWSVCCGG